MPIILPEDDQPPPREWAEEGQVEEYWKTRALRFEDRLVKYTIAKNEPQLRG